MKFLFKPGTVLVGFKMAQMRLRKVIRRRPTRGSYEVYQISLTNGLLGPVNLSREYVEMTYHKANKLLMLLYT